MKKVRGKQHNTKPYTCMHYYYGLFFMRCIKKSLLLKIIKYLIFVEKYLKTFSSIILRKYMENAQNAENAKKYYCEKCNFTCSKKSDWSRHIQRLKHVKEINGIEKNAQNVVVHETKICEFICKICSKKYNTNSGLWKHNIKCKTHNNSLDSNIIIELVKQNTEFKELLVEQNKFIMENIKQNNELTNQVIELSKEKTITNNNTNCNNKKFNLNFFLNETCKETDFVSQLSLGIQDLIDVGELGFAEGVSKSFIKGLKELDVCKRPLHCTDKKRETIYVKDENKWQKEDDKKDKLTKASKQVGYKNVKTLPLWKAEHPNFLNPEHEDSEQFSQIIIEAMTCGSDEKTMKEYDKIIRNVIKEIFVDKIQE